MARVRFQNNRAVSKTAQMLSCKSTMRVVRNGWFRRRPGREFAASLVSVTRAVSSAGERRVDIAKVSGSIPLPPTILARPALSVSPRGAGIDRARVARARHADRGFRFVPACFVGDRVTSRTDFARVSSSVRGFHQAIGRCSSALASILFYLERPVRGNRGVATAAAV